jgi:hypothetical protein
VTPLPLRGRGAEVSHLEVLITGLLLAVAALGALACRLKVPYPIMLVIGGAIFGFIPGLPEIRLDDTARRRRGMYEYRAQRFAARLGKIDDDGYEDRSSVYQQMVRLVLQSQRDALIAMRRKGELSNEGLNRILRDIDLEESRLEI